MRPYDLHFFPYPPLYLLAFLLLLGVLLVLLRWGLIRYVYERLGLSRRAAMLLLFAALVGSGINIPLMQLPAQRVVEPTIVNFFGMQYVVPRVVERGGSVLAVNVGGAIIPLLVALRLIRQHGITRRLLLSLGVVTVLMYHLAQPIPGVGIALPPILPSVATAVIALLLDRRAAPRTAFIAGTLGTLVGADLLNLGRIRDLGAPVASIGGAGTFDGVFMIGVVAVLLAGLPGSGSETPRDERPIR
jgi:uncharacterized membrane protein